MIHNEKPATRGRNGLSENALLGGCEHPKDSFGTAPEQARAAEIESRRLQREGLALPGALGIQQLALAEHFSGIARSFMGARHG